MLSLFRKGSPGPLIASNINSLVHEGNNYFAHDLVLLNQPLTANLYSAEDCIIEHEGVLNGDTHAKHCVICGMVNGTVNGTEKIEVKSTAVIKGVLSAPVIDIEPGAKINGKIKVTTDIYAMLKLDEALKKHLPAAHQPGKASALEPYGGEFAKPAVPAATSRHVAAAIAPDKQADDALVTTRPVTKSVAAASPAYIQDEAVAVPKPHKPVAAAVPLTQQVEALAAAAPRGAVNSEAPANKQVETAPHVAGPKTMVTAPKPAVKTDTEEAASGRWW